LDVIAPLLLQLPEMDFDRAVAEHSVVIRINLTPVVS
jgi:hypothetical protein